MSDAMAYDQELADALKANAILHALVTNRDAEIARLRGKLKAIQDGTVKGTVGGEDVVWFDGITTLHDFCDEALNYEQSSPEKTAMDRSQDSWYCAPCAVEVRDRRCPHCGKTEREQR